MGRKQKNILQGVGVGALAIALGVTVYFGWFSSVEQPGDAMMGGMQGDSGMMAGGTPPSGGMGPGSDTNGGQSGGGSDMTPPGGDDATMPSGDDSTTPPEKPDGEDANSATPPEKPDGGNSDSTTPPEKPDGDGSVMAQNGQNSQPTMPGENTETNIFTSVIRYVLVVVEVLGLSFLIIYLIMSKGNIKTWKETFASSEKIAIFVLSVILATGAVSAAVILISNLTSVSTPAEQMEMGGSTDVSYSAANEITTSTTLENQNYSSETANENALAIYGDITATLSNSTITKTGDADGGDNTSFYGTNSALIVRGGTTANLSNLNVTTDANGANGVFCYGGSATTENTSSDGSTVNIADSTITTKKDSSGGIMVTGGGVLNASNLTISTVGVSSAAIRSDRGGGTMTVDGGTYTTAGAGSPTVYSTADVTVKNATLNSETAEGIVIEGKNSVALENVTLNDNNNKLNGQSTTYKNIFLYQSMSGDASEGVAEFSAQNSNITTENGDTFYITNTAANIALVNNQFANNDASGNFLRIQADSWGNSGSNGGDVTLNFNNQTASGNVVVDNISTLNWNLTNGSNFKGAINSDNSAESIDLMLDAGSTLTLTADSYITSLNNADSSNSNINLNGFKLYVNSVPLS